MSGTSSWATRSENYRYSQDDRAKQWKYEKELTPKVEAFVDDLKQNSLVLGKFNFELDPWRMAAIYGLRKYNVKILEKACEEGLTEITIVRQKLSRVNTGR
jgi:hypothetical protein